MLLAIIWIICAVFAVWRFCKEFESLNIFELWGLIAFAPGAAWVLLVMLVPGWPRENRLPVIWRKGK